MVKLSIKVAVFTVFISLLTYPAFAVTTLNITVTGDNTLGFDSIVPTSPTTHFDKVNDSFTAFNDSNYIKDIVGAEADLFNKASTGLSNVHIDNITLYSHGQNVPCQNNRGPNECAINVWPKWNAYIQNSSGSKSAGTSGPILNGWQTVSKTWTTSPFTSWYWNLTELENLKVGGNATAGNACDCGTNEVDISQLYLSIVYEPWSTTYINVSLVSPSNNTVQSSPVTFNYLPRIDGGLYKNCSLFTNYTGSWVSTDSNASAITDGAANSITHTFASNVNNTLWNIYCYNATGSVSNSSLANYTINITASTNTCTYSGSGDWYINIADDCNETLITNNVLGKLFVYGNASTGYLILGNTNLTGLFMYPNATGVIALAKGYTFTRSNS